MLAITSALQCHHHQDQHHHHHHEEVLPAAAAHQSGGAPSMVSPSKVTLPACSTDIYVHDQIKKKSKIKNLLHWGATPVHQVLHHLVVTIPAGDGKSGLCFKTRCDTQDNVFFMSDIAGFDLVWPAW